MYISPHRPDDPRRVANLKLYPLRQTPYVVNPANFLVDPPLVLAHRGVDAGGLPLTFRTTPTTSSSNVLLVISSRPEEAGDNAKRLVRELECFA